MASSRHVDAFVRRLEDGIAQEIHARSRVALAYSGGLASTLIAMIARKRCVLDCIVAGVDGSPDILAAKAAKAHLDYRVEYVILSREDAMRIRAQIVRSDPELPPRDADSLVPLHATLERAEGRSPRARQRRLASSRDRTGDRSFTLRDPGRGDVTRPAAGVGSRVSSRSGQRRGHSGLAPRIEQGRALTAPFNPVCENHEASEFPSDDAQIVRLNRPLTNGRRGRRPRGGQSVGGAPTRAKSKMASTTLHLRRRPAPSRVHAHGLSRFRGPSTLVLSARGDPQRFPCARRGLHVLVRFAVSEQSEL